MNRNKIHNNIARRALSIWPFHKKHGRQDSSQPTADVEQFLAEQTAIRDALVDLWLEDLFDRNIHAFLWLREIHYKVNKVSKPGQAVAFAIASRCGEYSEATLSRDDLIALTGREGSEVDEGIADLIAHDWIDVETIVLGDDSLTTYCITEGDVEYDELPS